MSWPRPPTNRSPSRAAAAFRAGYRLLAEAQAADPAAVARLLGLPAHRQLGARLPGLPGQRLAARLRLPGRRRRGGGGPAGHPVRAGCPGQGRRCAASRPRLPSGQPLARANGCRLSSDGERLRVGEHIDVPCAALVPDDGSGGTVPHWRGIPLVRAEADGRVWEVLLETADRYLDRYTLPMLTDMTEAEVTQLATAYPGRLGTAGPPPRVGGRADRGGRPGHRPARAAVRPRQRDFPGGLRRHRDIPAAVPGQHGGDPGPRVSAHQALRPDGHAAPHRAERRSEATPRGEMTRAPWGASCRGFTRSQGSSASGTFSGSWRPSQTPSSGPACCMSAGDWRSSSSPLPARRAAFSHRERRSTSSPCSGSGDGARNPSPCPPKRRRSRGRSPSTTGSPGSSRIRRSMPPGSPSWRTPTSAASRSIGRALPDDPDRGRHQEDRLHPEEPPAQHALPGPAAIPAAVRDGHCRTRRGRCPAWFAGMRPRRSRPTVRDSSPSRTRPPGSAWRWRFTGSRATPSRSVLAAHLPLLFEMHACLASHGIHADPLELAAWFE